MPTLISRRGVLTIPKPPNRLVIFSHLGMGDAIICNGLCRVLATQNKNISFMTYTHYIYDVRRMFEDLKNVQILGVSGYDELKNRWIPQIGDGLKLGYSDPLFNDQEWDREFYRQAGLPFEDRWRAFRFPVSLRLTEPRDKLQIALIHEDPARGFVIDRTKLPKDLEHRFISKRASFWDWLPDILAARELHLIDSSYLNLVDSLHQSLGYLHNTRLVWHKYARKPNPPHPRAPWTIL